MHRLRVNGQVKVLESYLAPTDFTIGELAVRKGHLAARGARALRRAVGAREVGRPHGLLHRRLGVACPSSAPVPDVGAAPDDTATHQPEARRMTTEMHKADGVHRPSTWSSSEVSLVDRAANKHRFLIVKRDEAMDDDKTQNTTRPSRRRPLRPAKLDDNSALNAALAALESLTGLVELLGDLGADHADARLAGLAEAAQRRHAAPRAHRRRWRDRTDQVVDARAKSEPATFAANVTAAKQALAARGGWRSRCLRRPTARRAKPDPAPAAKAVATDVNESLAKLAESFRALGDREGTAAAATRARREVRTAEQRSARRARLEGHRRGRGMAARSNKPKDRESVDKAISFHDL